MQLEENQVIVRACDICFINSIQSMVAKSIEMVCKTYENLFLLKVLETLTGQVFAVE